MTRFRSLKAVWTASMFMVNQDSRVRLKQVSRVLSSRNQTRKTVARVSTGCIVGGVINQVGLSLGLTATCSNYQYPSNEAQPTRVLKAFQPTILYLSMSI